MQMKQPQLNELMFPYDVTITAYTEENQQHNIGKGKLGNKYYLKKEYKTRNIKYR